MATDMDIDMDLDVTLGEEDMIVPEAETMVSGKVRYQNRPLTGAIARCSDPRARVVK